MVEKNRKRNNRGIWSKKGRGAEATTFTCVQSIDLLNRQRCIKLLMTRDCSKNGTGVVGLISTTTGIWLLDEPERMQMQNRCYIPLHQLLLSPWVFMLQQCHVEYWLLENTTCIFYHVVVCLFCFPTTTSEVILSVVLMQIFVQNLC